jgi:hypothetical protein
MKSRASPSGYTGDVTLGSTEACDYPQRYGVSRECGNDWNSCGCGFGCQRRRFTPDCYKHSDGTVNEFCCERRKSIIYAPCPAIFNDEILALDGARFGQPPLKRCYKR